MTTSKGRAGVAPSLDPCERCGWPELACTDRLCPNFEQYEVAPVAASRCVPALCWRGEQIAEQLEPPSSNGSGPEKAEKADEGTHALYRAILRCAFWATPR